jgi:hypothetical protein
MACKTCGELVDAYRRSVSLFRNAVLKVAGAQGLNRRLAVQEMTQLEKACMDANDALREHMRQPHPEG